MHRKDQGMPEPECIRAGAIVSDSHVEPYRGRCGICDLEPEPVLKLKTWGDKAPLRVLVG